MKYTSKIAVLILCLLYTGTSSAQPQKTYTFDGFFNGANLNIQCRNEIATPWVKCTCIDSISVNGDIYEDILYQGQQVDIANKLDLGMYDSVHLEMFVKGCELRILNPTDFYPKEIFPVEYLMISEDGTLSWAVQQNFPDLKIWVQIEQYKWGDWNRIGPIFTITEQTLYRTNISDFLFNGENKFRAVVASINHLYLPGSPVTFNHKSKKSKFKYNKKSKTIKFNKQTPYELWDYEGVIYRKGSDTIIDVSKLKPGTYRLNYANRIKKIKIK